MSIIMKVLERIGVVVTDEIEPQEEREERMWLKYPLQDRRGRSYVLVVDEDDPFGSRMWVLPAQDTSSKGKAKGMGKKGGAAFVGYIEVVRKSTEPVDTITLADIRIADPANRYHGLGTAMLRTLFRLLREHGVWYISGFVTPEDQATTPGLLEWYRREGFEVTLGTGRSALLRIDLDKAGSVTSHAKVHE